MNTIIVSFAIGDLFIGEDFDCFYNILHINVTQNQRRQMHGLKPKLEILKRPYIFKITNYFYLKIYKIVP